MIKPITRFLGLFLVSGFIFVSCTEQSITVPNEPTAEDIAAVQAAGFSIEGLYKSDDGSLWIENDINLTVSQLKTMKPGNVLEEQYSTDNLVNSGGARVITVFMDDGSGSDGGGGGNGGGRGKPNKTSSASFSSAYATALDEAISRFNAQNLELTFERVTSSAGADIVFTRLGKRDERRGVLGSAGFPTSSGDPYGEIKMSGILQSTYGLSTNGIATIMAHEMGHCIGFRHTDFFDRSISCGGSPSNEGTAGIGANHIQGTPTGADLQGNGSWMLACTDGSDRPFTNADKTALDVLY